MPAAITHYLHGKRVLNDIKGKVPFSICEGAFYWGAQGPDFLFCSRFLPWQKGEKLAIFGGEMHSYSPLRLFTAMRNYEISHQKELLRSYIFGFLCHYGADRTCHPFICSEAAAFMAKDSSQSEEVFHNQIESALDTIILRYETAELPSEFPLKKTVPKDKEAMEEIAGLYVFLFQELFQKTVSNEQMLQALKDCRTIFGLLTDRTGLKKNFIEKLEKKGKRNVSCHIRPLSEGEEDYANVLNEEWHWPSENEKPRNENFFDLYEAAVQDAEKLIERWISQSDEKPFAEKISFGG